MPFKSVVDQTHIVTESTDTLSGMNIPNPSLNQGGIVHVVETGNFYGLVLDSTKEIDNVNVLPTILGGTSRWLLLNIAASSSPPETSVFHSFGRVTSTGEKLSGERFQCFQVANGQYRVNFEQAVADSDGVIITFGLRDLDGAVLTLFSVDTTGFNVEIRDLAGLFKDDEFNFLVVLGKVANQP